MTDRKRHTMHLPPETAHLLQMAAKKRDLTASELIHRLARAEAKRLNVWEAPPGWLIEPMKEDQVKGITFFAEGLPLTVLDYNDAECISSAIRDAAGKGDGVATITTKRTGGTGSAKRKIVIDDHGKGVRIVIDGKKRTLPRHIAIDIADCLDVAIKKGLAA